MTKYLINSIGLALVAAGQSMIASAADMADVSGLELISGSEVSPGAIAAAELDGEGLPWDERLNASTKTKTDKGLWTKKKGVDDITRATIVKQLREKYPAPQAAAAVNAMPGPASVTLPGTPVITLPGAAAVLTPYQELCSWLAANTGDGRAATSEWVAQTFASANTTLADLATADGALLKQWLNAFRAALAQPVVA